MPDLFDNLKAIPGLRLTHKVHLWYRDGHWHHSTLGEITEDQAREIYDRWAHPARAQNTGSAADCSGGFPGIGLVFD